MAQNVMSTRPVQYRTGGWEKNSESVKSVFDVLISGSMPLYGVHTCRLRPDTLTRIAATRMRCRITGWRIERERQLPELPELGILNEVGIAQPIDRRDASSLLCQRRGLVVQALAEQEGAPELLGGIEDVVAVAMIELRGHVEDLHECGRRRDRDLGRRHHRANVLLRAADVEVARCDDAVVFDVGVGWEK